MLLLQQKYINVQYLNFVSFSLQIIFIVSGIIWKSNVGLQLCSNYRIVVGHGSGLCFTIKNKIFTQLQSQILRKHSAEVFFPLYFSQIAFLAWNSNFSTDFISSRSGVISCIWFMIQCYSKCFISTRDTFNLTRNSRWTTYPATNIIFSRICSTVTSPLRNVVLGHHWNIFIAN